MISNTKIYVLLSITLVVYLTMIFVTIPKVLVYTNGSLIPDLMPLGYSLEYIKGLFESMGELGRNTYFYKQLPLDFVYPGFFIITFYLTIKKIYFLILKNHKIILTLSIFPVLGGLFDYLENISIVIMLYNYPNYLDKLVPVANIFSICKTFFSTITFVLIIIGLLMLVYNKLKFGKTKMDNH